jgi:ATP-binding protein involved in chromosome partitioning
MSDDYDKEVALQKRLDKINHAFVVLSGKGGVGKSTVAVNLALTLALRGFRTGLLDVDIHGPSIPKLLGLTGKYPIVSKEEIMPLECWGSLKVMSMGFLLASSDKPVIWRGPMKANMIKEFLTAVAWGELDYLVVDCPPGTGDEPLSVAQHLSGKSSAIIVTTPQQVATIDVEKCVTFCRELKMPIEGLIENMGGFVCPHCGEETHIFSKGGGERLAGTYGIPLLGSIPLDPDITQSGEEERPYVYFYSKTKTAQKFEAVVDRIIAERPETAPATSPDPAESSQDARTTHKEDTMKFAVPTSEGRLCAHFGHCETFAIIDTNGEGKVVSETHVEPPPHEPGLLPEWLSQKGVNCVIAGGMGSRAQQLFAQKGIRVITGAQGEYPREVVELYLKGTLQTGANTCDH